MYAALRKVLIQKINTLVVSWHEEKDELLINDKNNCKVQKADIHQNHKTHSTSEFVVVVASFGPSLVIVINETGWWTKIWSCEPSNSAI